MAPLEDPAGRLKSAIQSACSLRLEIPPIIEKATNVFIIDELLEKEEYEKLVIAMGEFKEDDCIATAPLATLVTEKLSLVMTRLLRKCVEKQTWPVEYNKFVMTASKQPFPQEVKDQLLVLVDLANVETLPTSRVIETVDTLTKKKPAQLPALHKVKSGVIMRIKTKEEEEEEEEVENEPSIVPWQAWDAVIGWVDEEEEEEEEREEEKEKDRK